MIKGRLAPSPTGAQHIGNARTYLVAWLSIRSQGGRVVLRIEDIDSPRIKPWATFQALQDLCWLGLDWDEGPIEFEEFKKLSGETELTRGWVEQFVQSYRIELYERFLQQLIDSEKVYPCTCSRSEIESAASAPHAGAEGIVYPRTCFQKTAVDAKSMQDKFAWRFRFEDQKVEFVDRFAGSQSCKVVGRLGDFVVYKSDGSPAYQLAVVVDDHEMGINEVVRGDDLIPSTFRQLALYDFFGWDAPEFVHLPLVVGSDQRRLAKRHGDTRLSHLRELGATPERLVGLLAQSCGWQKSPTESTATELLPKFDLGQIPKDPYVFDQQQLKTLIS